MSTLNKPHQFTTAERIEFEQVRLALRSKDGLIILQYLFEVYPELRVDGTTSQAELVVNSAQRTLINKLLAVASTEYEEEEN